MGGIEPAQGQPLQNTEELYNIAQPQYSECAGQPLLACGRKSFIEESPDDKSQGSGPAGHEECGQGIHHLSFGEAEDHDEVVSVLKNHWIDIEMSGVLGTAIRFTYMATQKELGTIFEVIKTDKDKTITLVPYGSYPPPD